MNTQSLRAPQNNPKDHPYSAVLPTSCTQQLTRTAEPKLAPDSYLRSLASANAQKGNYSEAIALLSQLIDRHPHDAIDYNNRGLIYFQSGQLVLAIADYNTAIQLSPRLASAYNNRANYYAACGQRAAAIADYDRALDLNPSHVRAWINRGITLRELGQYDQAIENFDIAEVLGQLNGHIYAERGRTYHLWGEWNCAIADYHRALTHLPQQAAVTDLASRLRLQVQTWLSQLLTPLPG